MECQRLALGTPAIWFHWWMTHVPGRMENVSNVDCKLSYDSHSHLHKVFRMPKGQDAQRARQAVPIPQNPDREMVWRGIIGLEGQGYGVNGSLGDCSNIQVWLSCHREVLDGLSSPHNNSVHACIRCSCCHFVLKLLEEGFPADRVRVRSCVRGRVF